ncbi:MAG: glutamate formimidoyltransferase [Candidatus Izemoplasmataceae bacterium]
MKKIIQCVPNFSEGRDLNVIETIVAPLKNQEGFKLVSYEPDKDYNRTVVTLIGDPNSMKEPLMAFIELIIKHIDMKHHQGEHPRMGALDVLPFIPIDQITMDECVAIANEFAQTISERFNLPIYMYAEAAKESKRKKLPTIRKGEFEGLNDKMKDPLWKPDYGQAKVHETFGALAIGARLPLIAYNIDLDTTDLKVASFIAKAIRSSSGGFKHIQAGPVFLKERNHVQVTMNILNDKENPIYRILETVKMEAKRFKVDVLSSEVVGLIPKDAIVRSLKYYFDQDDQQFSTSDLALLTKYAIKYLGFRDFDKYKIIEANIDG